MTANLEMSCASNDDFATVPRDESGDFLSTDHPYIELTGRARLTETKSGEFTYRHPAVPELAGLTARAIHYTAETGGQHYDVMRLEPVQDDTPHNGRTFNVTPAYVTRHDSGITLALAMHAVNAGFAVNSISQERGARHGKHFPSLDTTAYNHFAIADTLERTHDNQGEKLQYDEFGYSRGGILVYRRARAAHHLGRSTRYLEVLAAVCHHDSSLLRTVKMFASLIPYETVEMLTQIAENPNQVHLLADTVGREVETIKHAYDSAGRLLEARTSEVIDDLPEHQRGMTTVYGRDPFGHRQAFLHSFSRHPGMSVRYVKNVAHLGAMRETERVAFGNRLKHEAATIPTAKSPAA